jgi:hypothetical protein
MDNKPKMSDAMRCDAKHPDRQATRKASNPQGKQPARQLDKAVAEWHKNYQSERRFEYAIGAIQLGGAFIIKLLILFFALSN